jgi:hypothetical protein
MRAAIELMELMIARYEEVFTLIIADLDSLNTALESKCEKLLFTQAQVSEQLTASKEKHMAALQRLWDKLLPVAELRQDRVRSSSVVSEEADQERRTRRASSESHQFVLNSLVWKLCGLHRGAQDRATELPSELKQVSILPYCRWRPS